MPLIIWSSGSGWLRDDGKEGAADVAAFFTRAGYAVAGVSVRSSAQALFPAQVHDAKTSVRWLRAHAGAYGIDPDRFAIMGNSSGGWLALMVTLTAGVAELDGPPATDDVSSRVQAAVDFFGPTDFLQMDAHMLDGGEAFRDYLGIEGGHDDPGSPESRLVGGPIESRRDACARANPIAYVGSGAPPLMILHGQADPFVPHHQSELLYDALHACGNEAIFYSIPGVGHEFPYVTDPARAAGYVAKSTRAGGDLPPPTWETIEGFVANALQRPSESATIGAGMARSQSTTKAAGRRRLLAATGMAALLGGIVAIVIASGEGGNDTRARTTVEVVAAPVHAPVHRAAVRIHLTGVGAYDPQGDGTENDSQAVLATDGNGSTAWKSERYHASFTKSGVGLVLDAGRTVKATHVTVATETPGYTAEMQVGASAKGPFVAVSDAKVMTAKTTFVLRPRSARYLMLWITAIPAPGVAAANEITATAGG